MPRTYKFEEEEVTVHRVVNASKMEVLLWLLSFGKYSKLYELKEERVKKYSVPPHPNCRCICKEI